MNKCYVCSYFLNQNNAGLIQICSRSDPFYDFSRERGVCVDGRATVSYKKNIDHATSINIYYAVFSYKNCLGVWGGGDDKNITHHLFAQKNNNTVVT